VFVKVNKSLSDFNYGFGLQVIEPEHVDIRYNEELGNGNIVKMGIEYDKWRKPIAYYIKRRRNDNVHNQYNISGDNERIPAKTITGEPVMFHLYIKQRADQSRGLSWLLPAMYRFKMLTGYEEAALVNARASAAKMGFFTHESPQQYRGDSTDDAGNPIKSVEPGQFEILPDNMKFIPYDPKYPSDQHEAFKKSNTEAIASALDVDYASLTTDLSNVNYSSIRAGLIDTRDRYKKLQNIIIERFLKPVSKAWYNWSESVMLIRIAEAKRYRAFAPQFQGVRWDWVDPAKDVKAKVEAINNGLDTLKNVCAEKGMDWRDVLEQRKREKELMDEYGLTVTDVLNEDTNDSEEEPVGADQSD